MTGKWQPIETAPKDGTEVLLFYPDFQRPLVIGYWTHTTRTENGVVVWDHAEWNHDRMVAAMFREQRPEPTYWMPLPDPPQHTGKG